MSTFGFGALENCNFKVVAQEAMRRSKYDHNRLHICIDEEAQDPTVGQFSFWDNWDYQGVSVLVNVWIEDGEVWAEVATKEEMMQPHDTDAFIEGDSWADLDPVFDDD